VTALAKEVKDSYKPTIGIETHVQLKTKTKLFSAVNNDARQAPPNTLISHICVGLPGALPVLNQAALELSALAAFALGTEPQKFSKFDRKHYFYPDLPKGYQISQYDQPIIKGGYVEIEQEGQKTKIGITRANLEEDAGKNTHPPGAAYSLVDLNRAGTPLLEIVSEPEIHSPAQAKAYARELYLLMKYAGVTEGDLYHGNLRFDVNVSINQDPTKLGTRSEVKNLNSFRSIEAAITYEIERQIETMERGEEVVQETRGWDEAKQKTTSQRTKEEVHDYRYMPEPDIPPIELSDEDIKRFRDKLPKQPVQIRAELASLSVEPKVIEDLLDRPDLVPRILEAITKTAPENARRVAFDLLKDSEALEVKLKDHVTLAEMVRTGELSVASSQLVLEELKKTQGARQVAERLSLIQVSDTAEIEKIVTEVLAENQTAAEDARGGKMKAIGFLVGQVMAKNQGRANPALAQQIIKKKLGL